MRYTVKQLAQIAGVSVRTLHHYEAIGLLKPAYRADNKYRHYEEKELLKLQQILFFKELEFSLEHIKRILSASDFQILEALSDQKKYLELKQAKIASLLDSIDIAMVILKGGEKKMTDNDTTAAVAQLEEFKREARKRWGHTDAYKQSQERTKHWTKKDYARAAEEGKKFTQKLAGTMDKGFDSSEFQALIAEHYRSINNFYDCSYEMYRNLADMYITDPRFRQTYDGARPGLAKVMQQAIYYYCERHEKK